MVTRYLIHISRMICSLNLEFFWKDIPFLNVFNSWAYCLHWISCQLTCNTLSGWALKNIRCLASTTHWYDLSSESTEPDLLKLGRNVPCLKFYYWKGFDHCIPRWQDIADSENFRNLICKSKAHNLYIWHRYINLHVFGTV